MSKTATPPQAKKVYPPKPPPAPSGKAPVRRQASGRGLVRVSSATSDLLDDPSTVRDWDDEELARGRRKGVNGRFVGRDPLVVPTFVYKEIVRRQLRKAETLMAENLEEAVRALVNIAKDSMAEDKDRIAAVKLIMDRVMGKPPEKMEVDIKTPAFVTILQGGIVPVQLDQGDIIDAEVISDSEDVSWEG